MIPSLQWDSWVTIGIDQVPNSALGQGEVQGVASPGQNWLAAFSAGGGIDIDDDGRRLGHDQRADQWHRRGRPRHPIGQFTTDGVITGTVNFQLFLNGDPKRTSARR